MIVAGIIAAFVFVLALATDTPNKRLDGSAPKQNRRDGKNQSR